MNHHQLETDIEHLEQIMRRITTADRPLPLSYWRQRLEGVWREVRLPTQVKRVEQLSEALRALEACQNEPPRDRVREATRPTLSIQH